MAQSYKLDTDNIIVRMVISHTDPTLNDPTTRVTIWLSVGSYSPFKIFFRPNMDGVEQEIDNRIRYWLNGCYTDANMRKLYEFVLTSYIAYRLVETLS